MKNVLYCIFILLLFSVTSNAQKKYIQLEHKKTGEVRKIKEDKRIVVVTNYKQKIQGKFKILNENQISIKGEPLNIDEIDKIKRQNIGVAILGNTIFYTGAFVVLGTTAFAIDADRAAQRGVTLGESEVDEFLENNSSSTLIGLATGFSLVGIGSAINLVGASKNKPKWHYKIIEK